MTPDRYQKVKEIFQAVTAMPAEAHAGYLENECGDDGELRREVDSLLEHHYRSTQLLEDPAPDLRSSKLMNPMPPGYEEIPSSDEDEDLTGSRIIQGRFTPGTVVANRYRIVELLGKGGMGEVYRADDLTLTQSVALKFLPPIFSGNPRWLARFHNEVRFARQVAHPNVCRVFDIDEYAGEHFISMEYIDGEDLASLLRRIGRLPQDKCIQIARQLCSGLAAAHEKGLLHRDLKPANVMVDGRGNVRITDFGLAAPVDQLAGKELRAGTPAYMSPEQLLGREITVKSDIYSLGLVLYEIFTGRQTFEAGSFSEYVRLHQHVPPQNPAVYFNHIDPVVETVVLRCLEKDPARRFTSAISVAAALPGGDPLGAAIAAGETPSPEMVAAAGGTARMKGPVALTLMGLVVAGVIGIIILSRWSDFLNRLDLTKPPVVLEAKAKDLIEGFGYHKSPEGLPIDHANGFAVDYDFYQHVQKTITPESWDHLSEGKPGPVYYWYRESPKWLVTPAFQGVGELDPSMTTPNMIRVELNPHGDLLELEVVPQFNVPVPVELPIVSSDLSPATAAGMPALTVQPVNWEPLFMAAGLKMVDFKPSYPTMTPADFCDVRVAWELRDTDRMDLPIRVEAGGFHGRATFFKLQHRWPMRPKDENSQEQLVSSNLSANAMVRAALILTLLVAAMFMSYRNLTSGRADRSGALRLSIFFAGTGLMIWALRAHHVGNFLSEFFLFSRAMGDVLYPALLVGSYYLALEPYVRRIWPEALISWSRLLSGRVMDPLIGRHALIGSVAGVICILLFQMEKILPPFMHLPHPLPILFRRVDMLIVSPTASVLTYIHSSLYFALLQLLMLVLLRTLLRKRLLAGLIFISIGTLATTTLMPGAYVAWVVEAMISAVYLTLLVRFGLVSLVTALLFFLMFTNVPLTPDTGIWYSGVTMYAVATTLSIAAAATYIAVRSRSTFRVSGLTKTNP